MSTLDFCAVAYAVVYQPSKSNEGLVLGKPILSGKDITMHRLKLIEAHSNKYYKSSHYNIRLMTERTESTVVLHWLRDQGNLENRVQKI